MEQGIIDIRNKAIELSKKFGTLSPYNISCGTLILLINELEAAEQSVQPTPSGRGGSASSRDRKSKVTRPAKSG
mgnify:CR=1 FL=1